MDPINILVIDDEVKPVQEFMNYLKESDDDNQLGRCLVDNKPISCNKLEDYNVQQYDFKIHAVLIDYQLNTEFTGILVAAWMMLQLQVPRITLTSGDYPGPPNYFDAFIRKDEISDNPQEVIRRIVKCVQDFDYEKWLKRQYKELASEYRKLIHNEEKDGLSLSEEYDLRQLSTILDKFDKLFDARQNEHIKKEESYLLGQDPFRQKEKDFKEKMAALMKNLDVISTEGKKNE
ncbi:MAG: hypothetical protein ABF608_06010 [Sporolactobacillus sp.]